MFSLLVHLHGAALATAVSPSFCHSRLSPPLVQAAEMTPQLPPGWPAARAHPPSGPPSD